MLETGKAEPKDMIPTPEESDEPDAEEIKAISLEDRSFPRYLERLRDEARLFSHQITDGARLRPRNRLRLRKLRLR